MEKQNFLCAPRFRYKEEFNKILKMAKGDKDVLCEEMIRYMVDELGIEKEIIVKVLNKVID